MGQTVWVFILIIRGKKS